jgi:hypothetical protein
MGVRGVVRGLCSRNGAWAVQGRKCMGCTLRVGGLLKGVVHGCQGRGTGVVFKEWYVGSVQGRKCMGCTLVVVRRFCSRA